MDCSIPGFPVLHYLPEFAQTNARWVNDAIQPSHPLSSPSLPALDLSQHQGFSKESALHIRWPKYWSFSFSPSSEYIQGWFPLGLIGLISLLSKGLSRAFSSTTIQKHKFFGCQRSYSPTLTSVPNYWKHHSFDFMDLSIQSKWCLSFLICCLGWSQFFFQGASVF